MPDGSIGAEKPVIIKRRRKSGHDGHHGGAWKVAYADFVTAMWAFFILLWLLNTINSEQRKGIADYFAPASVSQESSGSGGLLGGRSITAPGAQMAPSSPITPDTPSSGQPPTMPDGMDEGTGLEGREPEGQRPEESRFQYRDRVERAAGAAGVPPQNPGEALEDFAARVREAVQAQAPSDAEGEARGFQSAAAEIRQTLQSVPDLEPLARNLLIDQTAEGLRIQIVDGERVAMFPGGSAQMYPQTRHLMLLLARVLAKVPNRMAITGHTDASAFAADAGRDNWSLSFERANALKRVLVSAGIGEERVQDIAGRADRDLLVPDQPNSPRNRRVSIVLLRERGGPAEGAESPPP